MDNNINLDAILAKKEYKRMTRKLKVRVEDIAGRICTKMHELEITSDLYVNSTCVKVCTARASVGTYDYLAICSWGSSEWHSLEDINHSYNYANDFDAHIEGATNAEALRFLTVSKEIILKLGEVETQKVNDIAKALQDNIDN